jgi:hypothetical protein
MARDDLSPDGSVRILWDEQEARMSHWILSPRVLDVETGETLLDLWGTSWDAAATFPEPGLLRIALRHYPGDTPGCVIVVDVRARTFELGGSTAPLGELCPALDALDLEQMIARARADTSERTGWPEGPEALRRLDALAAHRERWSPDLRLARLFRSANTAADNSFAWLLDRIDRAARKLFV